MGSIRVSRLLLSLATFVAVVAFLVLASPAPASYLVARNATDVSLKVDAQGRAIVYYKMNGLRYKPLFWGAVNARPPSESAPQLEFKKDYSGGWGAFRRPLWKTMKDTCRPYDGPELPWLVMACKAPDGSWVWRALRLERSGTPDFWSTWSWRVKR
jgi:hypothetical protein